MCLDMSVGVRGQPLGVNSFLLLSGSQGSNSGLLVGSFILCHLASPAHSFIKSSDFLLLIKDNDYRFRRKGLGSVETPKSSKELLK